MANDSHGVTQTYHVKSGQGFMIFPGQINTYISDEKLPWEYTWIEFDGLRAKETIELPDLVWIIRFIKLLLRICVKY